MNKLSTFLGIGAALLLTPFTYASFITGSNLNISDTDNVAVNLQYIDFGYTGAVTVGSPEIATGTVVGVGSGPFSVSPSSGSFAGLTGIVNVADLCQPGVGPCADPVLAGVATSFANFITFSAKPSWTVTLTMLDAGGGTIGDCAGAAGSGLSGQSCTIPGSPFTLTNTGGAAGTPATGVNVALEFQGTMTDGSVTNPVTGNFSTQFSGTDLQTILADINAGKSIANSASGTLTIQAGTSTVPEPASFTLAGLGGVLIALGALRRKARG